MKWSIAVLMLLWAANVRAESVQQASEAISGFVSGRAELYLRDALPARIAQSMSASLARMTQDSRASFTSGQSLIRDAKLRERVLREMRDDLRPWLVDSAREVLEQRVFGDALRPEDRAALAPWIADMSATLQGAEAASWDAALSRAYDSAALALLTSPRGRADLQSALLRNFQRSNSLQSLQQQLARGIGNAAASAMQQQLAAAMSGHIADILQRPVLMLPTPAYAAILAGSAAAHFARAFAGIILDMHELQRGIEVLRVMTWQLQHKQRINLTLLNIANIGLEWARDIGAGRVAAELDFERLRKRLPRVQELSDRLQQQLPALPEMSRVFDLSQLRATTDQLRDELNDVARILREARHAKTAREIRGDVPSSGIRSSIHQTPRAHADASEQRDHPVQKRAPDIRSVDLVGENPLLTISREFRRDGGHGAMGWGWTHTLSCERMQCVHDERGRLLRAHDDVGHALQFEWEDARIVAVSDERGQRVRYEYNARGDLIGAYTAEKAAVYRYRLRRRRGAEERELRLVTNEVGKILYKAAAR